MLAFSTSWLTVQCAVAAPDISAQEVKSTIKKVADWQINTFEKMGYYRALPQKLKPWQNRDKYGDLEWQCGALYVGMYQWSQVSGDSKYEEWLKKIGDRNGWKLNQRPYHADDQVVGQLYLSLYKDFTNQAMLAQTQERLDWVMANPKNGTLIWNAERTDATNRWGWCDALFMAPPVWAKLAAIEGNQKYLDFMDHEFHATYDLLWDKDEHLFWRDSSFFKRREANGKKLFWARGNGWVLAGLALIISDLPEDWKGRTFYVETFCQMAARIKDLQRPDGTWSMGLLGGTEGYPIKESSGTSLFVFGLAWGVNHGLLDRATYKPVILKSWRALEGCVTPEGLVGYIQPVGAAPGDSFQNYSEVYGVGAFLAAGAEVYKFVKSDSEYIGNAIYYNGIRQNM